jgi:glutamate synthase domain-containing protein 2
VVTSRVRGGGAGATSLPWSEVEVRVGSMVEIAASAMSTGAIVDAALEASATARPARASGRG